VADPRKVQDEQTTGVFYVDAPDGYIALAVFFRGKRVARLEIAADWFSSEWVKWLERWLRRRKPADLKLI